MKINRFVAKTTMGVAFCAAAAVILLAPRAYALTYTTSGLAAPLVQLGDQMGNASPFDTLAVAGASGTFAAGPITLNTLAFTAGVNAYVPAGYNYSFSEQLSLSDGSGTTLTIPFTLSINYSDTLTIAAGSSFSFLDGGSLWQVVVNALTLGPNPGGTMYANLTAQVSDPAVSQAPLPAALPLFATGLGALGLLGWRRKRKKAAAVIAAG
jgi:hypothetical protein